MIESLKIDHIPCFGADAPPLQPFAQITFLYGPNGSGKSSIAKSLNSMKEPGRSLELFDKDFVELLLHPDQRIPGVFAIRDGNPDDQKRIDELTGKRPNSGDATQTGEIKSAETVAAQFNTTTRRQEELIVDAKKTLTNACWQARKALPEPLQQAFQGFLRDSNKNVSEALRVRNHTSAQGIKSEDELVASYETLGEGNVQEVPRIAPLPSVGDLTSEQAYLLEEPIKPKDETSFGDFTRFLSNADWLRQGLQYLNQSNGQCPFCQQAIDKEISASLNALFDHFYADQIRSVRQILAEEERRLTKVSNFLSEVRADPVDETPAILKAAEALEQRIVDRKRQIESKVNAPSSRVVLPGISDSETELERIVATTNERIDEINSLLRNREHAKDDLKKEVWRYYVHSVVDNDLATFDGAIEAPTKALKSLRPKLESAKQTLIQKREELADLQKRLTSAAPTVEAINSTLRSLGFLNFTIQHLDDDDSYRLTRADGTPASHTLSEGERTLISFLYYFHKLLRLHEDKSASDRVVAIIDDPVSSLDGETLFVINLLLRTLFESCVQETGRLEQVILLTHNAFFYKESVFTPKGVSPGTRSYLVLTKEANGTSTHKHYERSPIKSNYTQLWDQVRAASEADNLEHSAWLPNAMRRIIENYFQIAGGLDTDKIIADVSESDWWACQALLSWYNDGSHTAPWDVDYSSISSDATMHLRAFRQIFEAAGHSAHFEMMMQQ